MIKVKMAYSSGNTNNSGESGGPMIDITLTTRGNSGGSNNAASNANKAAAGGSGNNALNISNFGEYNDAGKGMHDIDDYYNTNVTTTHFAIPLEELLQRASDVSGMEHTDDDWVPAELDDSTLHISSNLMNVSEMAENSFHQQQLNASKIDGGEDWGVFDPNDGEGEEEEKEEDQDDEDHEGKKKSKDDDGSATQYSDIEVTRAVNDSTTSDQARRASILQSNESGIVGNVSDKGGDSIIDTNDFPMNLDDDDQHNIMMDSDDDDSELARRRRDRHSLRLSDSNDETNNNNNSRDIGISFDSSTDADIANTTAETATKGKAGKGQQRPRKRRKIITDDGRTELSSDHIRAMIADTSDICRSGDLLHPATWVDPLPNSSNNNIVRNKENETLFYDYSDMDQQRNRNFSLMWNSVTPQERLFCRPALGDDGHLSSELLDVWTRNCAPVMNRPFPYDLIDTEKAEEEVQQDVEEDHEIEQAREHRDDNSEIVASDQPDEIIGGNDPSFEMADGNDNVIPFDDDDDRMPMPDDDPENLIAADSPAGRSQNSMESIFSLGATNEMDIGGGVDFDGAAADGENDYDASTTTTSKWHKNTVKVFEVLKKNLISPDGEENDDDMPKKEFVSYNTLSDGVSRRTAAGFFFELLQLKTLNYIELNQDESYGDITISAGVKFTESPPSN